MTNISDPIKQKKFFVKVEGKDFEVSLEKKKWAIMHGEDNLIIKDGEIALKPPPKLKTRTLHLFGSLFFDEKFSLQKIIGIIFISSGVFIII